jgi:hypothetical protein
MPPTNDTGYEITIGPDADGKHFAVQPSEEYTQPKPPTSIDEPAPEPEPAEPEPTEAELKAAADQAAADAASAEVKAAEDAAAAEAAAAQRAADVIPPPDNTAAKAPKAAKAAPGKADAE